MEAACFLTCHSWLEAKQATVTGLSFGAFKVYAEGKEEAENGIQQGQDRVIKFEKTWTVIISINTNT